MATRFRLTLESNEATLAVIALLRRHTAKSYSELRAAVVNRKPILDEAPHHNVYSEFITRVTNLVDDLEASGFYYRVEVDGVSESPQYLRNLFQGWQDGLVETQYWTGLESGEPCIETLQWLKREAPSDIFLHTIRQIIHGDGYTCDEETVAWAKRELSSELRIAAAGDET